MMNNVVLITLFGIMSCGLSVSGQVWKLHLNTNEAFILGNKLKGQYPALWHDKNDGLLVGGFGLGTSYTKDYKEKYKLKYQFNLIRQRYYDDPYLVTDASGAPIYGALGINTNYNIITNFTINHSLGLNDKWLFGTGLGFRLNVISHTDYGNIIVIGVNESGVFKNLSTSRLVFILPIEVTYQFRKVVLGVRSEIDLSRSSNLARFKNERFAVVNFEVAFPLCSTLGNEKH